MRYENRVKLTIRTPSSDPDNEYEEETTDWIEAHVTGVSSQNEHQCVWFLQIRRSGYSFKRALFWRTERFNQWGC